MSAGLTKASLETKFEMTLSEEPQAGDTWKLFLVPLFLRGSTEEREGSALGTARLGAGQVSHPIAIVLHLS